MIRLATLAVPVAEDQGKNPDADDAHVAIAGVHVPFDTETLQGLYPSREEYVRKVTEAAEGNVRDGFLLERDAADLIAKARNSIVGTGLVSGPLCANVSNFLNHPSTSNLRDHTLRLPLPRRRAAAGHPRRGQPARGRGSTRQPGRPTT